MLTTPKKALTVTSVPKADQTLPREKQSDGQAAKTTRGVQWSARRSRDERSDLKRAKPRENGPP